MRLAELDAGVVDQDVDRDAARVERREGRHDRGLVGHVEARRVHGVPAGPQRRRGLGQAAGSEPFSTTAAPASASPSAMARPEPARASR